MTSGGHVPRFKAVKQATGYFAGRRIRPIPEHFVLIAALLGGLLACSSSQDQDIFTACEKGNVKIVEHLLRKDPGVVRARDQWHSTALHRAAFGGNTQIVELLLNAGADIDAESQHGLTPLFSAVHNAQVQVVRLLIARGAKVDPKLDTGESPLHISARGFRAKVFYERGAGEDWAPQQMVEIAQALLDAGADVNALAKGGTSPLHIAARYGNKAMVELLLARGASVNAEDRSGSLPLHYLADSSEENVSEANLVETAKVLLAHGARVSQRDQFGSTPLEDAVKAGKKDVARLLQRSGGH